MTKFQKVINFLSSRVFIVSALIFIQLLVLVLCFVFLSSVFVPIYLLFLLLGLLIALIVINRNYNTMFKIAWVIPILAFPVGGSLFYLLFGRTHLNKKNIQKLKEAIDSADGCISPNDELLGKIKGESGHIYREARYIIDNTRSNVYENTSTEFLSPGSVFFESLLEELGKAQKFIFLEYFIIGEGSMWDQIHSILLEKIAAGVEVRLLYDDFGSITSVSDSFADALRDEGIKVAVFNPYKPSLDKFLNYRDHRKFAIIDGEVAFTGGINIADEYINQKERFGFWADASVKICGDAVWKVTVLFLQMWHFTTGAEQDYQRYRVDFVSNHDGYVIPFSDEPLIQQLICENAYINIINNAKDYVYICTPYLILDEATSTSLIRAARSGIRVVIITPHKPDKKLIFLMTQANYTELIKAGVEIYEFTPGFMHTKMIISDDKTAIVGTANFDYRSFYLHFENGIWMYHSKAVMQAKENFERVNEISERITKEFCENVPLRTRILRSILNLFSPLL